MNNYAMDTAARFGEIPFTEFTKELVTGTFDCLLESHLDQMESYVSFISSISQDLSTYINNTVDNVTFAEVSDFVQNYQLPKLTETELTAVMNAFSAGDGAPTPSVATNAAAPDKWWMGLINTLGPVVGDLVDKIKDPNLAASLKAIDDYNTHVSDTVPDYSDIQASVASLIASNKYALLQNISKQGMMRLVVTEGEIETKITFSTWNNSESGNESSYSQKEVDKSKNVVSARFLPFFKKYNKNKTRTVTVNTAKSYQRDSSGSKVDIFGRVLIKFKTDYAPLNG